MDVKGKVIILAVMVLAIITLTGLAGATSASDATNYSNNITMGVVNNTTIKTKFYDHLFTDLLNYTFPKNTTDLKPELAAYTITKPFYLYGVGPWWIVIVILTLGATYWFAHNGSPFLMIILLMIGNAAVWVFIPYDWMVTITACAIFSLSLMIVGALKGKAI